MVKEKKRLEIYLDSNQNGSEEIKKKIKEAKKDFPNKEIDTHISLNEFGMYVLKFDFRNKDNYWNRLKERRNEKRTMISQENMLYNNQKKYGEYKVTKTYKPY